MGGGRVGGGGRAWQSWLVVFAKAPGWHWAHPVLLAKGTLPLGQAPQNVAPALEATSGGVQGRQFF